MLSLCRRRLVNARLYSTASVPFNSAPLFSRRPSFWARWSPLLVSGTFLLFGTTIDLLWNHWYDLVPTDVVDEKGVSLVEVKKVPKPLWQRAGICTFLGFGCVAMSGGIMAAKTRLVRTLRFVTTPSSKPGTPPRRQLFVQTATDRGDKGTTFELSKCLLQEGRHVRELTMSANGKWYAWHIKLDEAVMNGKPVPPAEARETILKAWEGGRLVPNLSEKRDSRWKSGPVRD